MKKTINSLFATLFVLITSMLAITGCNTDSNQLESNQAYLIFNSSSSRAAENSDVEKLTNITLYGYLENGNTQTLGEWDSWGDTKDKVITIAAGNWNFTLTAKLDGTLYYDTVQKDVIAGITNKIEFLLTEAPAELDIDVNIADDIDYTPKTLTGENGGATVTYAPCKDGIQFTFKANEKNKLRQVIVGNEIWVEKDNIDDTNFFVVMPFTKKGEETYCNILIYYEEGPRDDWYIPITAGGGYKTINELCDLEVYNSFTYYAENDVIKAQGDYKHLIPSNSDIYLSDSVHFNFYKLVDANEDDKVNTYTGSANGKTDAFFGDGIKLLDLFPASAMNAMCSDDHKNADGTYRYCAAVTYSFEFKNKLIPGINFDYTGFNFTHTDWINKWNKDKYIRGNYTPKTIQPLEPGTVIWEPAENKNEFTVIPSEDDIQNAPERKLVIPGNKFRTENSELSKENTLRIWGIFNREGNYCNILLRSDGWKSWALSGTNWLGAKRDYFTKHGYVDIPLINESDELIADISTNGITLFAWWDQQQYTKIEIVVDTEPKEDSTVLTDQSLLANSQDGWNSQELGTPIELTENYKFIKASVSIDQLDEDYDEHNLFLKLRDSSNNMIACLEGRKFTEKDGFKIGVPFDIYCELSEPPVSSEEGTSVYGIYNITYAITHDSYSANNSKTSTITIHSLVLTDQMPPDAFGE